MGKLRKSHRFDWLAHLIADVLVRIAFFIGTAVLVASSISHPRHNRAFDDEAAPTTLLIILALSTFSALVGPWLYRTAAHRGRGSLKDVREESRGDQ